MISETKNPDKKTSKGKLYNAKASNVAAEAQNKKDAFKKGGCARKGRKTGGAVFSSAAAGTPRGKASHY